jgi:hypothetical protein
MIRNGKTVEFILSKKAKPGCICPGHDPGDYA